MHGQSAVAMTAVLTNSSDQQGNDMKSEQMTFQQMLACTLLCVAGLAACSGGGEDSPAPAGDAVMGGSPGDGAVAGPGDDTAPGEEPADDEPAPPTEEEAGDPGGEDADDAGAGFDDGDEGTFVEPLPSCSDGIDNDIDGLVDFPNDLGCDSEMDADETDAEPVSVFDPSHPHHEFLVFDSEFSANNPAGSDTLEEGTFRMRCAFSHFNYDDPIVYPNQPGAAHLHMYLGNTEVDHSSTSAERLRLAEQATCHGGPLNKTAYWVPSLIAPLFQRSGDHSGPNRGFVIDADERPVPVLDLESGQPSYQAVLPTSNFEVDIEGNYDGDTNVTDAPNLYYKFTGFGTVPGEANRRPTQAFPPGLRMIAGVFGTIADPTRAIRWDCDATRRQFDGERFLQHIPGCRLDNSDLGRPADFVETVRMQVFYPSCWNGVDLDSPDHAAHLAYPTRHPDRDAVPGLFCPGELTADPDDDWVRLPRVQYLITYPITQATATPQLDDNGRVVRDATGALILGSASWLIASDNYRTFGTLHDPNAPQDGEVLPGGRTAHGDWFMAWNNEVMATFVQSCINEERHCANGELGNGWRLRPGALDRVNDADFNDPIVRRRGNGGTDVVGGGHLHGHH